MTTTGEVTHGSMTAATTTAVAATTTAVPLGKAR
jgi:hypothetical protein